MSSSEARPSVAPLELAELRAGIERAIAELPLAAEPALLYEPMRYLLALPAKRMRPLLVLLAYRAFKPSCNASEWKAAHELAVAVELVHNFTLMHDDIMDRAPMRRGQATVHVKWDENTAILSGDAMFAEAMALVVGAFPDRASVLGRIFTDAARAVCEGQMRDMEQAALTPEALGEHPVNDYLMMIGQKTAALLGASLQLGAAAAGADERSLALLGQIGWQMGTAFQLQDDLLDVYAPESLGKQPGGDILENKKTYLWLRALEKADASTRAELLRWFATSDRPADKVAAVTELFDRLGIAADTEAMVQRYFREAEVLAAPLLDRPGVSALIAFLTQLASRKS